MPLSTAMIITFNPLKLLNIQTQCYSSTQITMDKCILFLEWYLFKAQNRD